MKWYTIINRPGVAGAVLQTASSLINCFTDLLAHGSSQRHHSPTVGNGACIHKIDLITIFQEILNLDGHQKRTTGSITAILLQKMIFFSFKQSGEAGWWRVCYQWGLPRLLFLILYIVNLQQI